MQHRTIRLGSLMLFRVVAVDMRGYGETDKPSAVREYTVQKLTDYV